MEADGQQRMEQLLGVHLVLQQDRNQDLLFDYLPQNATRPMPGSMSLGSLDPEAEREKRKERLRKEREEGDKKAQDYKEMVDRLQRE